MEIVYMADPPEQKEEEATRVDKRTSEPLPVTTAMDKLADSNITADDLDNIRHMLGVSSRCRGGYRNYFVAGADNVASMERLRAAGLVTKDERYRLSSEPCYHATVAGAHAIGLRSLPEY